MPNQVVPQKIQKVEFDVTTSEGPGRVTVVTGMLQVNLQATSQGGEAVTKQTYVALLDPLSAPGKFRKATATASLVGRRQRANRSMCNAPLRTHKPRWMMKQARCGI